MNLHRLKSVLLALRTDFDATERPDFYLKDGRL